MARPLPQPTKEVDVDLLVFIERYATDLLKWDILTFFGHNPDFVGTTTQIADNIGRRSPSIQPELGDLALLGILEQTPAQNGPTLYKLSQDPHLRQLTLKLADTQLGFSRD